MSHVSNVERLKQESVLWLCICKSHASKILQKWMMEGVLTFVLWLHQDLFIVISFCLMCA